MIIFNDKEYNSFKDLREKQHLVSEYEVTKVCSCWWKTVRKISEQNNIKSYSVVANNKECIVYDETIIDLLHSIKPVKNNPVPENYIPQKELIKHLGITLKTLHELGSGVGISKSIRSHSITKSFMTSLQMLKTSTTENFINGGTQIENMGLAGKDKILMVMTYFLSKKPSPSWWPYSHAVTFFI